MTGQSHEEVEAARRLLSQAVPFVGESHALTYALVMALASTPREVFSREEIDALACDLRAPRRPLSGIAKSGDDVRFWHPADVPRYADQVRFKPGSGHPCAGPSKARL